MDKRFKYKLPQSMRDKTLDLRTNSKSETNPMKSPIINTQPHKVTTSQITEKKLTSQKPKASKWKIIGSVTILVLCVLAVVYLIFLLLAPKLFSSKQQNIFRNTAQQDNSNRITISTVGINTPIVEGDISALEKGAWHRFPNQGDPTRGGNFVVTGHSFVWGYTPQQIKEKSTFYSLPDVKKDDKVVVKWAGKDYLYKVAEIKKVLPNQTDVENQTKEPQLTIYTCTLSGSSDGRVVVIAKPA